MKIQVIRRFPAALLAVGLFVPLAGGCVSSGGKSAVRVTEEKQYIGLKHVPETVSGEAEKSDALAMACPNCKTRWYQVPASALELSSYSRLRGDVAATSGWQERTLHRWEGQHYCPSCKSIITSTRTGNDWKETVKHTCNVGGEEATMCFASSNSAPLTDRPESRR